MVDKGTPLPEDGPTSGKFEDIPERAPNGNACLKVCGACRFEVLDIVIAFGLSYLNFVLNSIRRFEN
jgi:hypothetical protein